jgi:hypothetical protein
VSEDVVVAEGFFEFFLLLVEVAEFGEDLVLDEPAELAVGDLVVVVLVDAGEVVLDLLDVLVEAEGGHEALEFVRFDCAAVVLVGFLED